jgi:Fic family protein
MLVKLGFNVEVGRLLNPTAVFCSNRDEYYKNLALADLGTTDGLEKWCLYVLHGLREEIEKIDRLLDYDFLRTEILFPTIQYAIERKHITDIEARILRTAISKQVIQASDLKEIFSGKHSTEISRQIGRLIGKKMLEPTSEGARKYVMSFNNSYLLRGVIRSLQEKGFIAFPDKSSLF